MSTKSRKASRCGCCLCAFDDGGMMVDADVMEGEALPGAIAAMFADSKAAYLHVHNAKRGCFAARVDRH